MKKGKKTEIGKVMGKREEDSERGGRTSREQGTCMRNVATKTFLKRCSKKSSTQAHRQRIRSDTETHKTGWEQRLNKRCTEPKGGSKTKSGLSSPAIVSPSHQFSAVRDYVLNAASSVTVD